ncbi:MULTISPECIES: helicase-related protein [Acetobacteraceae]|uniref:helicase-related protein n=1 Tax=Acetobacteraceae TaxID=433 RepID=UPI0007DD00B2|nr:MULTISPECIES: C-terminal helicase domain-containing protein [Acetobacteraceae]GBQ10587.1 hypothetical protein AA16663_0543 [Komagataeibacter rhaeticus DSM 16663]SAY47934.1 RNA polymerase-associated protein RapA [Komagataeibacter rhaeticus]
MLGLTLREEFRGKRLKGTAIELSNDQQTGATQIAAKQFLEITYPTHDLLKGIEAVGPNKGRPVVVIGERGLGKSHLMAALYHAVTDPSSTRSWLNAWATINLQFARVLFNFDLPWNPMDMEQRIGRIHRYGQSHTAQVYNLVLSDTIEGRIFLLLDEKLIEIARTVGKVDEHGNVAEDLRAQILGQLSERLNYDRLYQEALSDPELKRTQVELEAALSNSREARQVVFDLFQDLDGFSLDDYKPFSDVSSSLDRLVHFLSAAVVDRKQKLIKVNDATYDLVNVDGAPSIQFTLSREAATNQDNLQLMGLDHSLVQEELTRWRGLAPEEVGIAVFGDVEEPVLLSIWVVEVSSDKGERRVMMLPIAVKQDGTRVPAVERLCETYLQASPTTPIFLPDQRNDLFTHMVEPTLQRELRHRGDANGNKSYSAELVGYVEISKQVG